MEPEHSGGSANHSSAGRSAGAVMHMARCWQIDDMTLISPSLLRTAITGSVPTSVAVKKSPGFVIWLDRPMHSHSVSNTAAISKSWKAGST